MARKFDLISKLYLDTSKEVLSPDKWAAFLRSACYNYRLRFDEQLLVYAQKPEATAVLQIERWNRTFGRWVNRGAKGIAVFERHDGVSQKLVHYFDISDTHAGEYARAVPIWTMQPEYTEEVITTLENTFGDLEDKGSLAKAIMSAANNAVEDNAPDYIRDLLLSTNDTFLEDLGEDSVTAMYKELLTNSVAYMMMTRLGVDTDMYFDDDDFRNVVNFNSDDTLNALGVATGAIAEMGLSEISKTVLALNRQNRTFAENRQPEYTNDRNNERSFEDGRTDLHNAGYLLPNLTLPEQPKVELGQYAQMRRKYLYRQRRILYTNLLTKGKLTEHLAETEQRALEMEERLLKQMAAQEGVTEKLKAADPLKWTRLMNNLRHSVQEIVQAEVIYA